MIIEIENYQIRPYPNHLCWEIWKYREVKPKGKDKGEARTEWVSEGVYPSTLGLALHCVWERLLKEGAEVVGLEEAIAKAEAMKDRLMAVEHMCCCEKEGCDD